MAKATIVNYVPFIREFLKDCFGSGPVRLSRLCARDVVRFVQRRAPRLHLKTAKLLTTALRSFLRYGRYRGDIRLDLAAAVPLVANWSVRTSDVAREAASALRQLFRDKNIVLDMKLPDDEPAAVVDRDRLFQVIINLLSNAVKFSPRDTGRVTLTVGADAVGVRLSVADNGPGIAPQHRDAIFERFRQVGDTLTAKPEGSGLGLAISRMIIEHFGGRAWVEDAFGGGAVFHVWLPREPAAASAA